MLYGSTDKFLDFGKCNDLIKFPFDLPLAHAQDGAIEINIFRAGELGMETCADFQQAPNAAQQFRVSSCRFCDSRKNLQKGRFTGAIAADQANYFAPLNFERSVSQRPDVRPASIVVMAVTTW